MPIRTTRPAGATVAIASAVGPGMPEHSRGTSGAYPESPATTCERVDGCRLGLGRAGLDPRRDAVVVTGPSDAEHAREAVLGLFGGPDPATAFVVANNHMMIGVVRALRELGRRVPDDVALVGFDDFEWADLFSPRLTTMAQPEEEIGRLAVQLLLDRIANPDAPCRTVRLPPSVQVRNSCGCVQT